MIKPQTPRGFRDFLPREAKKRQFLINTLKQVFEFYGFEPLETPALEFAETLKGKYGEEEKLIYEFKTRGGDEVALRYDQTVPLARVVAQYTGILVMPFKRYQIQPVWRGENPQKGRYREFLQCDADIVGSSSPLADAEILNLVLEIYKKLGLPVTIKINDRENFATLDKKYVSAIDKLEKIGESAVLSEIIGKGMKNEAAKKILFELQNKKMTPNLKQILDLLEKLGADTSRIKYEPTLARGLDYYTGLIFETVADNNQNSLCSGGRWDKMIGPAVGFGLGFDRTLETLEEQKLLPDIGSLTKVLITVFNPTLLDLSLKATLLLRQNYVATELYPSENTSLDKQLKYANQKRIPYVLIIGPSEAAKNEVTIRIMETGEQKTVPLGKLPDEFINS